MGCNDSHFTALLMLTGKVGKTVPITNNVSRGMKVETESNRGSSTYQPTTHR